MDQNETQVVTGAFGYLGRYIAALLVEKGIQVRTLTGHPHRPNPFGDRVQVAPYNFQDPASLVSKLEGATVVFNTYWVRFNYGPVNYGQAVANTQNLIWAAKEAGVKRFVHISITNPARESPLPYFRGKAVLEETLIQSGLSYAIIRPTVLFGREDILINNIAWLLRKFPMFWIFGRGDYRIQPVYVGDVAALAVELSQREDNIVCDAVGPETFTFEDLVRLIRDHVGSKARIMRVPRHLAYLFARAAGFLLRDVVITREEIAGLMAELLVSEAPPLCSTRFSEWLAEHANELGRSYASELERHYR